MYQKYPITNWNARARFWYDR